MICKLFVACLALAPVVIMAEKFYLGGCGDFECLMDGNAGTEQGLMTLTAFFSANVNMYMWDPSPIESTQTCNAIMIPLSSLGVGTFSYQVNAASNTYTGTAKYILYPHARLELSGSLPEGVLGANSQRLAKWYPLYISSTDVIVIACRNVFFGRRETIYVFTDQNYDGLNSTCAADAISTTIKKPVKAHLC